MGDANKLQSVWKTRQGKLLVIWFGVDGVLYLGALAGLVLSLMDLSMRPLAYGFTAALVVSWALRMAYGIRLELRRVRLAERERTSRLGEILRKHGLSEDASASALAEIRNLGGT
ncbi:MAG: hypothetical protein AB1899_17850 [Pseudomonadota bacterium]